MFEERHCCGAGGLCTTVLLDVRTIFHWRRRWSLDALELGARRFQFLRARRFRNCQPHGATCVRDSPWSLVPFADWVHELLLCLAICVDTCLATRGGTLLQVSVATLQLLDLSAQFFQLRIR